MIVDTSNSTLYMYRVVQVVLYYKKITHVIYDSV